MHLQKVSCTLRRNGVSSEKKKPSLKANHVAHDKSPEKERKKKKAADG